MTPAEIALDFNKKRSDLEKIDMEDFLLFIEKEVESREVTMNKKNSEHQISIKNKKSKHNLNILAI